MIDKLTIEGDNGVNITIDEEHITIEHPVYEQKIIMSVNLFSYAARQLVEMQNLKREKDMYNAG